jgi:crotonobetainyl-CoA:carnitine CoA-transferase CaiB-like acyl-CoA transferase
MSATATAVQRPAPCLGEHTDDVLARVLGYNPDQIALLRKENVLT